ncbi:hypothetical protein UWK_01587 [Desulfocapsa sulfexigens DSM 10523]|uniref:Uncharacterized protein n=1 Tax=Desulfocapsa sulfexigens (strain DSM 10523 / SB164P1) TaxID=1167006 RepID=M1PEJ5_DESSD|nr:hypothetical protein [Desulfocapsa sulfexigens]AGF78145.1 hypothetical protein UWK_01587 [Desulfocapsa sulfexigens DSM 10523]
MSIFKIGSFLLVFFFIFVVSSDGAELNCSARVFSGQDFMTPRSRFVIDEKVYSRAVCLDLPPGKYAMAAVWYNPFQQVQRQDKHTFYLRSVSGYSTFFWMKVLKKGPL